MAGKLIIDTIQTDSSFLQLNVGTTRIATMNNSGIYSNTGTKMIGYDGTIGVATIANTAITGLITGSQIANTTISANNLTTSLNLATNNVQVASIQTATGTPAITFAANGQITTANTPFILTGGQIQFPATQIASGDANCLDDYEEGSWTPLAWGSGNISSATGKYVKIGSIVYVSWYIIYGSTASSDAAGFYGLPFTCITGESARGLCVSSYSDYGAGFFSLVGGNSTRVIFYALSNGATLLNSAFSSKSVYGGAVYQVA